MHEQWQDQVKQRRRTSPQSNDLGLGGEGTLCEDYYSVWRLVYSGVGSHQAVSSSPGQRLAAGGTPAKYGAVSKCMA